jgi:hypothetical protein
VLACVSFAFLEIYAFNAAGVRECLCSRVLFWEKEKKEKK